jgi:hypothetical protein
MLPEGFVRRGEGLLEAAPELGVGVLGYGFMGKSHTNAYSTFPTTSLHNGQENHA